MRPPVLALTGSREFKRRVRMIAGAWPLSQIVGPAEFAASWSELAELARRHPDSPAVVDPCLAAGLPADGRADNDLPFAVAAPLLSKGDWVGGMRSAVLRAIDPERPLRLQARIRERAAPEAGRIMGRVLDRSFEATAVPVLAKDLGMPHWALIRRCAALAIPTPKKLIILGRVYTVERIAEWSQRPSGVVAAALGFLDAAVYRRMVRRALQAPPSALRQMGGAGHVGRVIVTKLALPATAGPPGEKVP